MIDGKVLKIWFYKHQKYGEGSLPSPPLPQLTFLTRVGTLAKWYPIPSLFKAHQEPHHFIGFTTQYLLAFFWVNPNIQSRFKALVRVGVCGGVCVWRIGPIMLNPTMLIKKIKKIPHWWSTCLKQISVKLTRDLHTLKSSLLVQNIWFLHIQIGFRVQGLEAIKTTVTLAWYIIREKL